MLTAAGGGSQQAARVGATICAEKDKPESPLCLTRHCEERSDEAIHLSPCGAMDCFAPLAMTGRQPNYLPGRSSRLSNPAAMLTPTWPCTLKGCSAIELAEPPTSTLPPTPTPSVALPCAPT